MYFCEPEGEAVPGIMGNSSVTLHWPVCRIQCPSQQEKISFVFEASWGVSLAFVCFGSFIYWVISLAD